MEERAQSNARDEPPLRPTPSPAHYNPIFQPKRYPSRKLSIRNSSRLVSVESETYVVQIPKEQVFSVPPPENAIIAERYRNPKKEENTCCKRFLCVVITLILLALIIGIIIWVLHLIFSPKAPVFSIDHVTLNSSASSTHKKTHLGYEITLKTKNPNEKLRISYSSNGDITLLHRNHKIAAGKFPGLDQDADSSTNVQIRLTGANRALPSDIQTSIEDKKGKQHVSLSLRMNVPLKMNFGSMKMWSKVIDVVCNFKVSSIGAGKPVLWQQCQSTFK